MSRIYNNKPLDNLPVHSLTWNGRWEHVDKAKKASVDNPGVLCDGKIVNQSRVSISSSQDPGSSKVRYYVLQVNVERAHKRKFDSSGTEIEPNFSETTKVSTGYLNSSYNVKAKGQTDRLTTQQVKSQVEDSKISAMLDQIVRSSSQGDLTLLMEEKTRDEIDLPNGVSVRLKTAGDSPFVESLVIRDDLTATAGNFAGDEKVGGNWTDKIMSLKSSSGAEGGAQEASEIGDDEWDD